MTQTSQPPKAPASGGNLKYILIGLLFLGGGGVIAWIAAGNQVQSKPAPPPPPPPAAPERANPMAEQNLVLEEEKPAEEPQPEPEAAKPKTGHSKMGEWECSGELDQVATKHKVNENYAQIRSCYERRLKVNNILQGDIKLRMKVGSTGKVVATSLAGSLHDAEVFNCVRNIAQGWTFAAPTGGNCAIVAVPLTFAPKQ